jgi:hypothetical protein
MKGIENGKGMIVKTTDVQVQYELGKDGGSNNNDDKKQSWVL